MLIRNKETTFAYRCPHCGATVFSLVGVFSLSGDMLKLKCSCKASETVITYTSEKKIRLAIPCIACPKPHNFVIGQNSFFSRDDGVLRLSCPYTGIDIAFIGEKDAVLSAVEKSNEELVALMKESGLDDISKMRGEEAEEDELLSENPLIEDVVFYMLKEFEAENAIHCNCEDGHGNYTYRLHHGRVTISCLNCGAMKVLPMSGVNSADSFLELDSLELE